MKYRKLAQRLAKAAFSDLPYSKKTIFPFNKDGEIDLCNDGVASFLEGFLSAMWPYSDGAEIQEDSDPRRKSERFMLTLETRGGTIAFLETGSMPGPILAKGILFAFGEGL